MSRLVTAIAITAALAIAACGGSESGDGTVDGGVGDADGGNANNSDGGNVSNSDGGVEESCDWSADFAGFFPQDRIVAIAIVFDDAGAWADMLANKQAKEFHSATITIDGESMTQVGVRFKGNSSLNMSQDYNTKSFKVDFEQYVDGQRFHCVDRFSLNNATKDPSMMREVLGYQLADEFGVVAPRTAYAELTVDGNLHGVFTMVQQVDHRFLKDRYGTDNHADDGNLYKLYSNYDFSYLGASATPDDYGDAVAETGLVLKTNEDDPTMNDFADVTAMTKALDDVLANPNATNRAALEAVFDIDSYLRYQAWTLAISNLDAYYGMQHNLYIYANPVSGKIETLPWDVNEAFGSFPCMSGPPSPGTPPSDESVYSADLLIPCGADRPLNQLSYMVPEYQNRYCELLNDFVNVASYSTSGLYNIASQDSRIAALHGLIGAARQRMDDGGVLTQPPGSYTYADYLSNQGHSSSSTSTGPGPAEGPNLGYFNDQRLANLVDLIADVCE